MLDKKQYPKLLYDYVGEKLTIHFEKSHKVILHVSQDVFETFNNVLTKEGFDEFDKVYGNFIKNFNGNIEVYNPKLTIDI